MQRIRSAVFTLFALLVAGATVLFAASVGLALAGILAVLALGNMLAGKLQPAPVRTAARGRRTAPERGEPRIWNDGRGTIIDL